MLKHPSSDSYLKGVIKAGVCKVGGVPKELPAFQRLERYPRVLGTDWGSPWEAENELSNDSEDWKLVFALRGVIVGWEASIVGPLPWRLLSEVVAGDGVPGKSCSGPFVSVTGRAFCSVSGLAGT